MRAALPLALSLFSATPSYGATFVIAVGNNFGRSDEPRLKYAEGDATEFADVLRRLGRVSGENTTLLTGEDAKSFRGVLLRMNARIRSSQGDGAPDHALIIYYSGHSDATGLHLGDSTLPFDELKAILESSPARVRVLIVDSCRSGGITTIKGAKPAPSFAIRLDDRLDAEGTAIITSSAGSEDSQESENLGASFFTHHFVNALRGAADRDRDTRVTINEAYSYAYKETLRSTGRTLKLQHPTYLYDIKGKGDFVFTYLSDEHSRAGRLGIRDPGAYLILEGHGSGTMIAEVGVEDGGTELLLSPGRYLVQRRAANSYREYSVELEKGDRVQLEDGKFEEVTYSRLLRKGGGTRTAIHRINLGGAARGSIIDGHGISPNVVLGYGLDLEWFSLGLGARWSYSRANVPRSGISTNDHEIALRLTAERYIDVAFLSFSFGLVAEGIHHRQSFTAQGDAPSRSSYAFGFGGLFAVEAEVMPELVLRIEGGPMSQVYKRGITRGGAIVGEEIATPLTWWAGLGAGWRL
jgi:hypothetical protein